MNDQTVIATIAERRVLHEEQQNLAGIAAATPGSAPHFQSTFQKMDPKSSNQNLLLHVHTVSKIQKIRFRN